MTTFLALDFETANHDQASACALALVAVADGEVVRRDVHLVRPPSREFVFTYIHGLTWRTVRDAPDFGSLWPAIAARFEGVDFVAAHNASFDRRVLEACCAWYGIAAPRRRYVCTVQVARRQWGIYPTKLPDVCRRLDIPLRHHDAGSDAEACARILVAAEGEGWKLS